MSDSKYKRTTSNGNAKSAMIVEVSGTWQIGSHLTKLNDSQACMASTWQHAAALLMAQSELRAISACALHRFRAGKHWLHHMLLN